MVDPLYSDVAVTWLGAVGCALYCRFLWRQRAEGITGGASLLLFGLLAFLLFVRGIYWMTPNTFTSHLVFAGAALLPLAIALFVERLLRRHLPFWLKLTVLVSTTLLFMGNLFGVLPVSDAGLPVFMLGVLVLVCAWSGILLIRARHEQLTLNESRRAYAMVIVAILAVPLVVTDFRAHLELIPMRLGGLAALLCVYVLLRIEHGKSILQRLLKRLLVILGAAVLLALSLSLIILGPRELPGHTITSLPLALGWMLLTGIWVRMAALTSETRSDSFTRWLLHARLDSTDGLLSSLRRLPLLQQHVLLDETSLGSYRLDHLAAIGRGRDPISMQDARELADSTGNALQDAGEQLQDLLERHQMTHALFVSQRPLRLLLVNLPEGADTALGRLHASIIQKLARRLSEPA
jgi:hypothetical protein